MSGLLLPNTPSGRAASMTLDKIRDQRAANAIANSSKTALSSDEFLSDLDILEQMAKLEEYVASQRDKNPKYDLLKPVGWRIAMLVLQPPDKTSGGLELPSDVTEQYTHKSMQGVVLGMGQSAYTDNDRFPEGAWCQPGDRIIFKRYDAQSFQLANGQRIGVLNDTQPIAKIDGGWIISDGGTDG